MRLVILCEGHTEDRVIKDFFAPYCPKFSRIDVINTKGSGNLANEFEVLADLELEDDPQVYVFCLIDLLNVPFTFPPYVHEANDPHSEKFKWLQIYMRGKITESKRDRFFAFPVVMEPETWLLADEQALNDYFRPPTSNPIKCPHAPEEIEEPTAMLSGWIRQFRPHDYSYKKMIHGSALFRLTNAQRVYDDNCPHFKLLIDELKRVQGEDVDPASQYSIPNETLYLKWAELERKRDNFWQEFEQKPRTDEEWNHAFVYDDELKKQIKNLTDQL